MLDRDADVDSPFFHPAYASVVARFRDDVRVGVGAPSGDPSLFFPFQADGARRAIGVGSRLAEFHGWIAGAGTRPVARDVLRACGLRAWSFDHLVSGRASLDGHVWATSDSPLIDLSGGMDAYVEGRRRAGSKQIPTTLRKARKFEREVGPLRLELDSRSSDAFDALVRWKSAQHARTGRVVLFERQWIVDALRAFRDERDGAFRGVMSVLRCGDRPVAVHLGLRLGPVLHWWFPAYDPEFARYSPGSILLVEVAREAAADGVRRIDLGRGTERYKQSFKSGDRELGEGLVCLNPATFALRKGWAGTKRWIRASPRRARLEAPIKRLRKLRERLIVR